MVGMGQKDCYIGYEAIAKRGILSLKYPVEHGIVNSWDDMEKLWHHIFDNELQVATDEHAVLHSEVPLNPKANREKLTQIMFETFNVPQFYVACSSVLSLYSTGRTTGCVIDSGFGVTHSVPVSDGYYLPYAVRRRDFGGNDITQYFQKILTERGHSFTTYWMQEIAHEIKEKMCYVAEGFDAEMAKYDVSSTDFERMYELPDGQAIAIGNEMIRAPELLFKPGLNDQQGVHQMIVKSVSMCDFEIRSELYGNVVACGGNAMFRGFPERLQAELRQMVDKSDLVNGWIRECYDEPNKQRLSDDVRNVVKLFTTHKTRIIVPAEKKYAAWIGGSVLSSLSTFEDWLIAKEEYDEIGPTIVHRKCTT